MTRKMTPLVLGILIAVLLAPLPLPAADDFLSGSPPDGDLARIRKKIEALRAWRISEELDLDEETSAKLFRAMREADEEGWRIESRNRELMRELALVLEKGDSRPGRISQILDGIQAGRMEKARVEDRHLARVREILSPEDTARYLVFQLSFQQELRERAARAFREGRQDGDSMGQDRSRRDSGGDEGSSAGGGKRK